MFSHSVRLTTVHATLDIYNLLIFSAFSVVNLLVLLLTPVSLNFSVCHGPHHSLSYLALPSELSYAVSVSINYEIIWLIIYVTSPRRRAQGVMHSILCSRLLLRLRGAHEDMTNSRLLSGINFQSPAATWR